MGRERRIVRLTNGEGGSGAVHLCGRVLVTARHTVAPYVRDDASLIVSLFSGVAYADAAAARLRTHTAVAGRGSLCTRHLSYRTEEVAPAVAKPAGLLLEGHAGPGFGDEELLAMMDVAALVLGRRVVPHEEDSIRFAMAADSVRGDALPELSSVESLLGIGVIL